LRAQGIPEPEAKGLIRAFAEDAIEFADQAVHDALWRRLDPTLASLGGKSHER
jgi:hypothetical protein